MGFNRGFRRRYFINRMFLTKIVFGFWFSLDLVQFLLYLEIKENRLYLCRKRKNLLLRNACKYGDDDCPVVEHYNKTYAITEADYIFLVSRARMGITYLYESNPDFDEKACSESHKRIEEIHYKIGYKSNPNGETNV